MSKSFEHRLTHDTQNFCTNVLEVVALSTWKQSWKKIRKNKNHISSFRTRMTEWLRDKRFGDGLLFCPLWTNYHSFLSNPLQPCYCAKFRGKRHFFKIIPLLLNLMWEPSRNKAKKKYKSENFLNTFSRIYNN